jgi:hypothetical protein
MSIQVAVSDGAAPESNLSMFILHPSCCIRYGPYQPRPAPPSAHSMMWIPSCKRVPLAIEWTLPELAVECDVVCIHTARSWGCDICFATYLNAFPPAICIRRPKDRMRKKADRFCCDSKTALNSTWAIVHSHVALICDFCELLTRLAWRHHTSLQPKR